jgi:excisionase family DNA binding protein
MGKGWKTVRWVMEHLSYSKTTVYQMVRSGELVAIKGRQGMRISLESIEDFIADHGINPAEEEKFSG